MKLVFRLFFLCCALMSYSSIAFAASETEIPEDERLYLHPKSIKFTEKGIAVTVNGQDRYTSQLNVDKDGRIYIPKSWCPKHHDRCLPSCPFRIIR